MNKLHRNLLATGLLAGIGLAAVAQTQTPPAPPAGPAAAPMVQGERRGMSPEQFRARMEERRTQHLGELKRILQVTPQQEAAWTTWTSALTPTQLQRPDRVEFARMTTPERIDRIRALRAQRNAEMDKRLEATKVFYAALTPEQKRLFDAEGMKVLRGMRGGMDGHGGHHRQG